MTFLRRVLSLVALLCIAAGPVAAQRINRGVVHRRSSQAIVTNDSLNVPFQLTPVNTTSIEACSYDCFYTGSNPNVCNYPGLIELVQAPNPPFRVTNYRKGLANGVCDGTPVSLPVSLQAGEVLLHDFEFSPTSPGSFSDALVLDMTPLNSPTSRFSWVLLGSTGSLTPIIDSFAATPPTVRLGQPVTLSWMCEGVTSCIIDGNVGPVPPAGSAPVSPSTTTTYTLTAMNGSKAVTSTVTVNVLTAPIVTVSAFPSGLLQAQGAGGATTSYTLTNAGGTATTITLSQNGTFFTQTPTSMTLNPGASQRVTITGLAQSNAGSFQGTSFPSGNGVPSGLRIPIKLLSAAPPAGTVTAAPTTNRVDVNLPGSGSVNFSNDGDATLTGILVSDVPWIVPQPGTVIIPPHSPVTVTFTIDRSQRSDSTAPVGSASGNLSLVYLGGPAAKIGRNDTAPVSVSFVTVVDTVQLSVAPGAPPPLGAGEVALFVPGVGHTPGSVGLFISDVAVLNPLGSAINDLRFYFTPRSQGTESSKSAAVSSVPSSVSVALSDVVKNVFGADAQVGSLQIRSSVADKLGVSTNSFVSSNPKGTFGTAIPTFRSDRAVGAGERMFLTGLAQEPTASHTNVFVQETAGVGVSVHTEFLSADASTLSTHDDSFGPFTLTQISSPPSGAVSAIMTNTSTGAGRFLAYATPVDEKSSDTWSVVDWSRQYGYSPAEALVIPVATRTQGLGGVFFRTDAAIMNTGSTPASGTLSYVSGSTVLDRQINLVARQTNAIADIIGSLFGSTTATGYLVFTPVSGTFAITSRTYATSPDQPGTFGSGTPTLALSAALKNGSLRAIGSLEDALPGSVKRPATFRTNFGLSEVTGNSVTVRVTLRFTYPAGAKVQGIGTAFKDYHLDPHQYMQVNVMVKDILGANRDTVGDLRGFEADFQVISGDGAVTVFTSSVDNGTADSILRTE